jgi:hypothetical protein
MPCLKIVKTKLLAVASSVLWIYRRIKWYSLIYRALLLIELLLPDLNPCDFFLWPYHVMKKRSAFSNTQLMNWKMEKLYSTGCSYLHGNFDKHTSKYFPISVSIWQEDSPNMFRTVFLCVTRLLPWTCVLLRRLPQYYVKEEKVVLLEWKCL